MSPSWWFAAILDAPALRVLFEVAPRDPVTFVGVALLVAAIAALTVVGGLALAAHGAGRLTQDVDIVTARAEQDSLLDHLEALGYRPLARLGERLPDPRERPITRGAPFRL